MKATGHPTYYRDAKITCVCGNSFTTGSTQPQIKVEICALCHPFFTGEMKFVDTMGRVERFQTKVKAAAAQSSVLAARKKKKQERAESLRNPKSLKDMLMGLK